MTEWPLWNWPVQKQRCPEWDSLASQFAVEAAESYWEGLHSAHGVIVVHSKNVFCHTTKLHHNVIHCGGETENTIHTLLPPQMQDNVILPRISIPLTIIIVNNLEILHWSLRDSSMEIENVWLGIWRKFKHWLKNSVMQYDIWGLLNTDHHSTLESYCVVPVDFPYFCASISL